jgi:hypothetical protein
VAAPAVLHARDLEVGQWAHYEERGPTGKLGELWLAAIGRAECGTWVAAELEGHGGGRRWILCVDEDQAGYRVTRALVDSGDGNAHPIDLEHPGLYGDELAVLRSRVFPPALTGTFGREDVDVPAGHFSATLLATNGAHQTWLHPRVPFGGAVKLADGSGRSDILTDFGNVGDEVEREFLARRSRGPGIAGFVEGAGGTDWYAGTAHVAAGESYAWRLTAGFRRAQFAVLLSAVGAGDDHVSASSWALGVRWYTPIHGLYVQALGGHGTHEIGGTTMADAATFTSGLGWHLLKLNNLAIGVEVDHQLEWVNGGQELTQGVSAAAVMHLDFGH